MPERIYLSPPHIGDFEQQFVADAFATNWIAPLGPHVDAFEREVAEYVGIRGALALNSGTAAIHLALRYLGVGRGDTVFCSSLTFIGSINPVMYEGAQPVFIDSEPESWNMSPAALERALLDAGRLGKLPKAAIVVNLYGQSANMAPLLALCQKYGVPALEDAAESLGAIYQGKKSGTFGAFGVFSFNGNKIITTSGGGMLVSDNFDAIEKCRFWSTQARDPAPHYQHSEIGYNYRLSNVLAAIGRGQLRVIEDRIATRRRIFDAYAAAFAGQNGVEFMPEASYGRANRWLTVMLLDPQRCGATANDIIRALTEENIEARPVWKPMHLQPVFRECAYYPHRDGESVSDALFERGICLPSGSNLSEDDQQRVIRRIKTTLRPS